MHSDTGTRPVTACLQNIPVQTGAKMPALRSPEDLLATELKEIHSAEQAGFPLDVLSTEAAFISHCGMKFGAYKSVQLARRWVERS